MWSPGGPSNTDVTYDSTTFRFAVGADIIRPKRRDLLPAARSGRLRRHGRMISAPTVPNRTVRKNPQQTANFQKLFLLDKPCKPCFNTANDKTGEAEVKPCAHPQRVPGAESGAKSGAAQWSAEGGGKGVSQNKRRVSSDALPPLAGRRGDGPFTEAVCFRRQARWHRRYCVNLSLFSRWGKQGHFSFVSKIYT